MTSRPRLSLRRRFLNRLPTSLLYIKGKNHAEMSHFVREGAGGATTCGQCSDDIDLERPRGYEAGEGPLCLFQDGSDRNIHSFVLFLYYGGFSY